MTQRSGREGARDTPVRGHDKGSVPGTLPGEQVHGRDLANRVIIDQGTSEGMNERPSGGMGVSQRAVWRTSECLEALL